MTRREAAVLSAVAQRLSNREIAEQFTLSARTVESHVSALLRKLAMPDRRALIEFGQRVQATRERASVPVPDVELIGREESLQQVTDLLVQPRVRLITVTGPPGVGKTLLGLHAAHLAGSQFTDGAVLVRLSMVSEPGHVLPAIADTLGVTDDGARPLAERVRERLATRRQLLVLDNFEHLVEAAPALADLLAAAPGVTALVTSRVRLRLRAEREVELAPLPVPDVGPNLIVDRLSSNDAVRLFVTRIRSAAAGFELTEHNAEAVAETVRKLDGLPLGLELAAARVPVLGVWGVRDRLEHRLHLLTHGARDLPAHQRTLRQAIATSYDLLRPDAQRLWRILSVFVGGARFTDLEAVWTARASPDGNGSSTQVPLLDALGELRDAHLVSVSTSLPEPRVEVLATLREFAAERLAARGDVAATRAAHAAAFHAVAQRASVALDAVVEQTYWLERLEGDHDNLHAALAWATVHDPRCAADLAGSLGLYWISSGRLGEADQHLPRVLDLAEGVDRERGRMMWTAGWVRGLRGESAAAAELFQASLSAGRELRDAALVARSLIGLGRINLHRGEHHQARAAFEEGLELARAEGDVWATPFLLWHQGMALIAAHDAVAAGELFEECVTHSRSTGDGMHRVMGLYHLGGLALLRGDRDRAQARLDEAAAVAPGRWSVHGANHAPEMLGRVLVAMGDTDAAGPLIHSALAGYREAGVLPCVAHALEAAARLALALGSAPRAVRLLAASSRLYAERGLAPLPLEQLLSDDTLAQARDHVAGSDFDAAWLAGSALDLTAAVADAGSVAIPDR